jgi:hypothetical protein
MFRVSIEGNRDVGAMWVNVIPHSVFTGDADL